MASLASFPAVSPRPNRDTAGRLGEAQDCEWQQTARGRHDIKQIEPRLEQPDLLRIARSSEDTRRDLTLRSYEWGIRQSPHEKWAS